MKSWISGDHFASEVRNQFDADGNVTASYNAHGGLTEYEYDESRAFLVTERMHPNDSHALEWQAEYDGRWGALTEFATPNKSITTVTYDALGRITSVVSPGDSKTLPTTEFEYELTSPSSSVTTRSRERSGETGVLLRVTRVDGFGRKRAEIQEGSDSGQWVLSNLHRLDSRGQVAFTAYPTIENSAELPASSSNYEGTATLRDALGRELFTQYPDGSETRIEYAPFTTTNWDENDTDQSSSHKNTPTTQNRDGLGRVVTVIEREATRLVTTGTYSYDAAGSPLTITDALGHVRGCGYDGRGRRVSIDDPNGGKWKLTYTDGNSLESRTDGTGNRVRFAYDYFARPLYEWHQLKNEDEQLVTSYHYDKPSSDHPELSELQGMLAWVEDAAGREYYGYDTRGRTVDTIRRWSNGAEHHSFNEYDSLGRLTRRGFPNKTYLTRHYDSRGLLQQLGPVVSDIAWTAHGALDGYTLGNGICEKRTYDNRRRLITMSATDPQGTVVRGLRYGLDAASRIVEISDLRTAPSADEDLTAVFAYDDRYRLTSATYRTGKTTWQYDDVSKILPVKSDFGDPHLNATNAYGENAGPDALTHHGAEAIQYDAAGRVIQDGERNYSWDAKGRLSTVVRGKTTENYFYAHDDSRAIKRTTTDGTTEVTRYIEKDVEERNGNLIRYAYLGEQRLARLDPVNVGPRTAPVTKTGSGTVVASGSDNGTIPDTLGAKVRRVAQRVLVPWGWIAIVTLGIIQTVRVANRRRVWSLPIAATRVASVSACVCILSLVALAIQACSGDGTRRALTFREQSVEITTLPEGAEFYLADAQESPLAVASKTASIISGTALHPFGHVRFQTGKQSDPWGFVGNEDDRGSGISDFHARPYRPELGVFLAVDPQPLFQPEKAVGQPAKTLAYVYAAADPVGKTDQDGRDFKVSVEDNHVLVTLPVVRYGDVTPRTSFHPA